MYRKNKYVVPSISVYDLSYATDVLGVSKPDDDLDSLVKDAPWVMGD